MITYEYRKSLVQKKWSEKEKRHTKMQELVIGIPW